MKTRTLRQISEDLLQIKKELVMIVSSASIPHHMEQEEAEILDNAARDIDIAAIRIGLVVEYREFAGSQQDKTVRKWIDEVAEQQEIDNSWDNPYPVLPHESED